MFIPLSLLPTLFNLLTKGSVLTLLTKLGALLTTLGHFLMLLTLGIVLTTLGSFLMLLIELETVLTELGTVLTLLTELGTVLTLLTELGTTLTTMGNFLMLLSLKWLKTSLILLNLGTFWTLLYLILKVIEVVWEYPHVREVPWLRFRDILTAHDA